MKHMKVSEQVGQSLNTPIHLNEHMWILLQKTLKLNVAFKRDPTIIQLNQIENPIGTLMESPWKPTGIKFEALWHPSGVQVESPGGGGGEEAHGHPSGISWESKWNPPNVPQTTHWHYIGSYRDPNGLLLETNTALEIQLDSNLNHFWKCLAASHGHPTGIKQESQWNIVWSIGIKKEST